MKYLKGYSCFYNANYVTAPHPFSPFPIWEGIFFFMGGARANALACPQLPLIPTPPGLRQFACYLPLTALYLEEKSYLENSGDTNAVKVLAGN
jgi:hypothetical protein